MRNDMKDVIVDTGRHRSSFRKGRPPRDVEELPIGKQSIRRNINEHGELAEFGDRTGPLRRFLLSQVGRKWDDVYSEICNHADLGGVRGYHLRLHVDQEVALATSVVDGVPYSVSGPFWQRLYVHDGVLHESKKRSAKIKPTKRKVVELEGGFYYNHEDVWYEVRKEPIERNRYKTNYAAQKPMLSTYRITDYVRSDDFHSVESFFESSYSFYGKTYGESVRLFKIKQCDSRTCKKIKKKIETDLQ